MSDKDQQYSTIQYADYLELDRILSSQHPRSGLFEANAAHEEMLFIIVHQVYELWFKQIIHELTSVRLMFQEHIIDERNMGEAVERLERVVTILHLTIKQIGVLETMTPLDFLDFRNYLFPASGFQSFQFRYIEVLLGLRDQDRITYNNKPYHQEFNLDQQTTLNHVQRDGSLFDAIEDWLERTPFLNFGDWDFLKYYKDAVESMLTQESEAIAHSLVLTDEQKAMRLRMLNSTDGYFESILDEKKHQALQKEGSLRLSYRATLAALLIRVYRDEPILQMPYRLLSAVLDMDEAMTTWRYRHSQMVLRMLGRKTGTGGSSGYDYLHATAVKHHIFADFHHISTLLIPRSHIPPLPEDLRKQLGFYFTTQV